MRYIKIVNKAYKLRIYPNKIQKELIDKTIGCSRFVYNYFLNHRIVLYKEKSESISFIDTNNLCTKMKHYEEYSWLKDVDKFALNNSLRDLDTAYKNFFKQGNGFPKFKSKHKSRLSYRTNFTNNNIQLLDNKIKLPKIKWIKFRDKRDFSNIVKILNVTVSKTKSGKYYASVCCEENISSKESTGNIIGVDLGLKRFAITSDGEFVENPRFMKKNRR